LIALGMTTATGPILIACALIIGGAVLASGDFWSRKKT